MNIFSFSESLLVLIEYVPFGDLLGYLRKSRGLTDTYYKDPDIKPETSLTSHQLMKFAWQVADGMSYLSSKRVSKAFNYCTFIIQLFRTHWLNTRSLAFTPDLSLSFHRTHSMVCLPVDRDMRDKPLWWNLVRHLTHAVNKLSLQRK